jgi:hypothetical protein
MAWLGRGNVAYAEGDRQAAADSTCAPSCSRPDNAAARNNLAELLLDAGCLDESRRQIERARRWRRARRSRHPSRIAE